MIRHAKSDWSDGSLSDFERDLSKRGNKDLETISSYLALSNIKPDLILTSIALRSQITADKISKKVEYKGRVHYLDELYNSRPKTLINVLSLQDDQYESIFLIGHNPEITELSNILIEDNIKKLPTLSVLGIELNIDSWSDISLSEGSMNFFIQPKQFKYYMPTKMKEMLENTI